VTAGLVIGAVLLVAMVGISCYGWVTLPSDALVPVHFGPGSYNRFVPKQYGLIMHPAAGALVFAILLVTQHSTSSNGSGKPPVAVILPIVMGVLVVVQAGAIRVARRPGGGPT
jgi:heme A synthase